MDWKKIGKKLLFPPVWVVVILLIFTAAAVPYVLLSDLITSPVAYGVYVVAFYTVCVATAFCVMVLPGRYKQAKQKIYSTKYGGRYMTDAAFRTHVSLYLSLAVNLLYAAMNIFNCALNRSAWFAILAGYYIILAVMRFLLVRFVSRVGIGKDLLRELRRSRLCAIILLLVNLSLSGAVLMMLFQNRGYQYPGVLIYVMAMYTFYMTTHAIIDIIKYRKYNSPVMSTSKIISLASALVSMLSLETAMFAQFGGDMAPEHQRLMIILTGAGVSAVVVTMSVYMIVQANRQMKNLK